jgi:excisionase family DNA binding protein
MVGGYMSVAEASAQLGVNESRVRALLASGQLAGDKLGGRWVVSQDGVHARLRLPKGHGRQLRPANAWSALALASGQEGQLGERRNWQRVLQLLEDRGIEGLLPRLRDRAAVQRFYCHPGVLARLAEADALCLSGASAAGAYELGLVTGEEVDAYVAHDAGNAVAEKFGLELRDSGANVVLRVLPDEVGAPASGPVAPLAAVAIDLAEQPEARAARVGHEVLRRLDRERRWRVLV